jgi:3-oxoadipate enol-lactonase
VPFAKVSCGELHYEIGGRTEAPVLVLSNSLGTTLRMWDEQAAVFGERFRVLRYDTRGHGQSSAPQGPYTLAKLGGDVVELLDALGIAQAHVCGISLGGMTALWLAAYAAGRMSSIVAANTAAKIGNAAGWNARIEQVLEHGMSSIASATMERWFTPDFRRCEPQRVTATETMFRAVNVMGYVGCCAALRDADLKDALGSITVPVLVIGGTDDPVTPPEDGHFLEREIAGAVYREVDAAHLSNIEDAAAFNAAVLEFLSNA